MMRVRRDAVLAVLAWAGLVAAWLVAASAIDRRAPSAGLIAVAALAPVVVLITDQRGRRSLAVLGLVLLPVGSSSMIAAPETAAVPVASIVLVTAAATALGPGTTGRRIAASLVTIALAGVLLAVEALRPARPLWMLVIVLLGVAALRLVEAVGSSLRRSHVLLATGGLLALSSAYRTVAVLPLEVRPYVTDGVVGHVVATAQSLVGAFLDVPWPIGVMTAIVAAVLIGNGLRSASYEQRKLAGVLLMVALLSLAHADVRAAELFRVRVGGEEVFPLVALVVLVSTWTGGVRVGGSDDRIARRPALLAVGLAVIGHGALLARPVLLDAAVAGGIAPVAVWFGGSVAFAVLAILALPLLTEAAESDQVTSLARPEQQVGPVRSPGAPVGSALDRSTAGLIVLGLLATLALAMTEDALARSGLLLPLRAPRRELDLTLWAMLALLAVRRSARDTTRPPQDRLIWAPVIALGALQALNALHRWLAGAALERTVVPVVTVLIVIAVVRWSAVFPREARTTIAGVLLVLVLGSLALGVGGIRVLDLPMRLLPDGLLPGRFRGLFSWPSTLGASGGLMILVGLRILWAREARRAGAVLVFVGAAAMVMADAAGAMVVLVLALMAAVVVSGFRRPLGTATAGLLAGVGALAFALVPVLVARLGSDGSLTGRGQLWRSILEQVTIREAAVGFGDRPLAPGGPLHERIESWGAFEAHNLAIEVTLTAGALGLLAYLALASSILLVGLRSSATARPWAAAVGVLLLGAGLTEQLMMVLLPAERMVVVACFGLLAAWYATGAPSASVEDGAVIGATPREPQD